jgi:hypothetical protein
VLSELFTLVHQTSNTGLFKNSLYLLYILLYIHILYISHAPAGQKMQYTICLGKKKMNKQKISIPTVILSVFPLFVSNKPNRPQTTSNEHPVILQRTHARSYLQFRPTRCTEEHKSIAYLVVKKRVVWKRWIKVGDASFCWTSQANGRD